VTVRSDALSIQGLVRPAQTREIEPRRLYRAGYWATMLLAFTLPFEATRRPLIQTSAITVTNLKIVLYVVVALAAASLARPLAAFGRDLLTRRSDPASYLNGQRLALAFLATLLVTSAVSALLSHHVEVGLKWTLDLAIGGMVWLAVPLWLSDNVESKVRRVVTALVAGAVIAAVVGFLEIMLGAHFSESLSWFAAKPTVAGSYLRLNGTFEYANIAAMYFELALPFAFVGLIVALHRRRWVVGVAWLLAVDILLRAVFLTYSRGALLGLFVGVVAMAVAARRTKWLDMVRRKQWRICVLVANLALVAGSVAASSGALLMLRLTSLSDQDWYKAAFVSALPARVAAGQHLLVPVTVQNLGSIPWSASVQHPFEVSYHWLFASGRMAQFEGIRTGITSRVSPSGKYTVLADLRAPCKRGHYLLVWDMVQETVDWFSLKSAFYRTLPVEVGAPGRGEAAAHGCVATTNRLQPTTLPTTLSEPPRQELWAAAIAMVRSHSILGVGPDSYRLSYGLYTRPKLRTWDTRIFANSLFLELFADLGLLGGGLFLAFFTVVTWPVIAGIWEGQVATGWHLALIGAVVAFLGHGLVDYILGADAIFALFWLLCGLAATVCVAQRGKTTQPC
jgi:hypothetical protein